jgi:nitroreductase/NAD-dependent dihydropyrimidine dehydrogenase PreA subunit
MVLIEQEKCDACELCVLICHEHCMSIGDGGVEIDHPFCSSCCQCVAVCPRQALSWNGVAPEPYESTRLPKPEQLEELLMERRTVRRFRTNPVPRELIREITECAVHAPSHSPSFRIIAIEDKETLDLIDREVTRYSRKIYRYLFQPKLMQWLIQRVPSVYRKEFLKAKPKLEKLIKTGCAYQNPAPLLIFMVGDRRIPLMLESAQYGLYSMMLHAQLKGIGCRNLVGNQMFLTKNKRIRKPLGLKRHERIFAVMGMGYPAIKFRNKVLGRQIPLQWI